MSNPSSYSFLPWVRQGLANKITTSGDDVNVKLRASIRVAIQLNAEKLDGGHHSETITRDIQLYGPGDIVGIEGRAIVRTEPRHWITNFEPNYLPYIEFYDEDFPWRYTPSAPDSSLHRLRPWIMLVVLKDEEFEEGTNLIDKPLPYLKLKEPAIKVLPPSSSLWAWAHVHVNRSLTSSDSEIVSIQAAEFLPKLENILDENPDLAYSRILSPRKLESNTPYHAFLVPAFESGRLAGLGVPLDANLSANQPAWEDGTIAGLEFPYYHRWYFRTGTIGDFEYLVRLLEAKPVDLNVGRRDIDVQYPGANLPGIEDPELGGILKLGGALRPPKKLLEEVMTEEELQEYDKYENWYDRDPQTFQEALASFINLASVYAEKTAAEANRTSGLISKIENDPDSDPKNDPDPMITPPLYGRWHALTDRLLTDAEGTDVPNRTNWLHQLNLDPRFRATAGFGTQVIQKNQEEYMNAAWEQVGDVLKANQRIREAQFAKAAAWIWHERHLKVMHGTNFEETIVITAPMQRRVVNDKVTMHQHFRESVIPPSLISPPMRRVLRSRGRLMRTATVSTNSENSGPQLGNMLSRINSGEILATLPKTTPASLPTIEMISDQMVQTLPGNPPSFLLDWLRRFPWLVLAPLLLILVVAILTLLFSFTVVIVPIGLAVIGALYRLFRYLSQLGKKLEGIDSIRPDQQTPDSVDRLPPSPDFRLSTLEDGFHPQIGSNDSLVAQRFKSSLKDVNLLFHESIGTGLEPTFNKLNLQESSATMFAAIDPEATIPARIRHSTHIPDRVANDLHGKFEEAWAYPEFDLPMYKPLIKISADLFLPNIQLVPQNSITLLETNQKFIEAYMVGLNHEFARELLWREYPTDQRGTYFRQFWDVHGFLNPESNLDTQDLREKLRDIPPIHRWNPSSKLGEHDHREQSGNSEEEVVLVIRGELLKKYPTAVIYAHRAKWQVKEDGTLDKTKTRLLDPPFDELADEPPPDKVKTPLYEAKVEPDIFFFGFDLTAEAIQGETKENPDDPGWFFVIKERPGEPRFGLDINKQPELNVWNDLSWEDALPGESNGLFPKFDQSFPLIDPGNSPKADQYNEDISGGANQVSWDQNTNSAELAYIFYQTPVLVAVHGAELLRKA